MKRILKLAVSLPGMAFLALCILGLPWIVNSLAKLYLEEAYWQFPLIIGLYAAALPFSFALYQAVKLLGYINRNKACSELAFKALKKIKYSAITISVIYVISLPLLFLVADKDDAPGLILFGSFVIFASLASVRWAVVYQKKCS